MFPDRVISAKSIGILGFQAVLTVLLLLLTLFASYVMITALLYVDGKGLHFRRNIFRQISEASVGKRKTMDLSWVRSSWVVKVALVRQTQCSFSHAYFSHEICPPWAARTK